jgi:hypothetical protein
MHSSILLLALSSLYTAIPVSASSAWTVNCAPLTVQRSDPLVSIGVASGHVHAIAGGTAFSRNMSGVNSAVDALQTTCDKFTDHSNYVRAPVPSHALTLTTFSGVHNSITSITPCSNSSSLPGQ